jgi:predicted neuraminidase
MGTFHDNKGELHGITVLVETADGMVHVGRCHEETAQYVLLLDVDSHDQPAAADDRRSWLERAMKWGVFPRFRVVKLERAQVMSIRPLNEL